MPNLPRDRSLGPSGGWSSTPKTCPKYPGTMPAYTLRAIAPIPGAVVTALAALPTVYNPKDDPAGTNGGALAGGEATGGGHPAARRASRSRPGSSPRRG